MHYLIIHSTLKRKQCPCKPGSVPLRASVIYLLRWLPSVSSILPSIVSRRTRTDSPPTMVYANLQPPDGTALRLPAGWWSLTPPSHPYPFGRLFSSPVSCCHQQLALSPVERPMLPGLSSRTLKSTSDRPLHCFQFANVHKKFDTAKLSGKKHLRTGKSQPEGE